MRNTLRSLLKQWHFSCWGAVLRVGARPAVLIRDFVPSRVNKPRCLQRLLRNTCWNKQLFILPVKVCRGRLNKTRIKSAIKRTAGTNNGKNKAADLVPYHTNILSNKNISTELLLDERGLLCLYKQRWQVFCIYLITLLINLSQVKTTLWRCRPVFINVSK